MVNKEHHDNVFVNLELLKLKSSDILPTDQLSSCYYNKLVDPNEISFDYLKYYQKYHAIRKKEAFRVRLVSILGKEFLQFVNYLHQDGVILFREFIEETNFATLVHAYDNKLKQQDRSEMGHCFLDFQGHVDFLTCDTFKEAFLHPLLLTLIAYELGGPVRLVDVRGKDTEPTLCTDRDNGLHIDDSPYAREYKFLLVWEKGKTSGPRGQNFVAIPGTQRLVRVVNSEHGANFRTPTEIINEILLHPKLKNQIFVMEAEDKKPLTIVFEATALAHQRFRTNEKLVSRSCLIFAFHIDDETSHPKSYLSYLPDSCSDFERFIIGGVLNDSPNEEKRNYFFSLIEQQRLVIQKKISEIINKNKFIPAREKRLSKEATIKWLMTIAKTPQINERKPRVSKIFMDRQKLIRSLLTISEYDKHADLDLELYFDRRELPRKSLRTRIREAVNTKPHKESKLMSRFLSLKPITFTDILNVETLRDFSVSLCEIINQFISKQPLANDLFEELIALKQLTFDVGNAFLRNKTMQDFRSHSIFLYLVFDEACKVFLKLPCHSYCLSEIDKQAHIILQHYAALVVVDDYQYTKKEKANSSHIEKYIFDIERFSSEQEIFY